MKIKSILIMAMITLAMSNCSQEEYLEEIPQGGITEFTAGVEGQSRSTITDAGTFSWATGDKISVWNGRTFQNFTYKTDNTFEGDPITPSKYAVYPAGAHSFKENTLKVNLPATYGNANTAYTENTNTIMVASISGSNLTFNHVGGLMRFIVKNVPAGAKQFVFTSSDNDITGDFVVNVNDKVIRAMQKKSNSSNNTVTIDFKTLTTKQDMTFYIPLPTGTYNGFEIEIKGNSTLSFTSNATNKVNRRTLLLMPAFECTNDGKLQKEGSTPVNFTDNNGTTTTITSESVEVNTSTATIDNHSVTLEYDPNSNSTLNISDDNKGESTQESKATVNVAVPANSTVEAFTVDAPTLTVELSTQSGSAIYETVTAKTAANTLKIKKGITVKRLILNGGHIIIESGAKVDKIENANRYNEETYIVNKGTITNEPSLSNVHIVSDESKIGQNYELRILTFEDDDAQFESYSLDYADWGVGREVTTWSDLIDDPQYGGPLTYGDFMNTEYTWWDENNTELKHIFPYNDAYCFWGGGHAISNYWGEGYTDEDRDIHIAKYYGEDYVTKNAGNDQMLGWFNLQFMTPVKAHSGDNFAVHYGYKDFFSAIENLPELIFEDGKARVIDHMYVTNTNYTLNQLYIGVKSEAGNTFGGSWTGLTETAWMKIVAQGFDDVDADAEAEPISEVEFYLVKGMNVVTDWQKWDLSGLGKVAKVRFNFHYSEEMGGKYGFTIPGYFAYDDVAVRF